MCDFMNAFPINLYVINIPPLVVFLLFLHLMFNSDFYLCVCYYFCR